MNICLRLVRRVFSRLIFIQHGLNKGKDVDIRRCVYFDKPEQVFIGDHSLINYGSSFHIGCSKDARITVGNNVEIGMNCTFSCVSHIIGGEQKRASKHTYQSITIEDGCWIGASCTVLQGVTIAKGCVIAAGSVVTKSTYPNGLYAGVPAVRKKDL